MRKIILIPVCVFVLFLCEFFLFNMAGRWFMPQLLLLAVIYFNLAFGIRYSLWAAVCAGLLKDSFSADLFGLHIFSFIFVAYMTTFLKKYLHYANSRSSRLLLVFFITVIHVAAYAVLRMMAGTVDRMDIIPGVFMPAVVTTLLAATFVFTQLRKCVSRLFA